MEHDIVKEALEKKGYILRLKFVPFSRISHDYTKYDGAVTVNETSGVKGYFSDVVIVYQNYAITLKSAGLVVDTIQDLAGKKVVAFQNASKILGNEYKALIGSTLHYMELDRQISQVEMLYLKRVDVVVSDINIFKYYRSKVTRVDTVPEPVYHEIFPPTLYKVLFKDEKIRDAFNQGLSKLRQSGRYQQIIDEYVQ